MLPDLKVAKSSKNPHKLLPVFSEDKSPFRALPEALRKSAAETTKLRQFKWEEGSTLLLPFGDRQWCVVGLGIRKDFDALSFAESEAKGFLALKKAGANKMDLLLPLRDISRPADDVARIAGEALLMAGYEFQDYRGGDQKNERMQITLTPASISSVADPKTQAALRKGAASARETGAGISLARDLINHPAAVAHPDFIAAEARKAARAAGAKFKQIRGDALAAKGYHAIHAVGRAAETPPSLVALEYGARRKGRPTLALVGKGVTFDTGGLDLKPSSAMALMKKDMGGAAIVLGAFRAIAGLGLPLHLVCVLALAENAVGPRAYRPGDVLRTKAGPTVEITNTDAEGRLVLADAFGLAREYKPTHMVDFATLTGACRIALGRELMGLFCDDDGLREALTASAAATGDHLWPLPLWKPYRKMLDSSIADLANASAGGMAGAVTAALFLKEFAGDVAWAHLDCYAWSDGNSSLFPKGGSGVGVRLCTDLAGSLIKG